MSAIPSDIDFVVLILSSFGGFLIVLVMVQNSTLRYRSIHVSFLWVLFVLNCLGTFGSIGATVK